VREQRAFQKAIASCGDLNPATEYQRKYPNSRYRRDVDDFVAGCRVAQQKNERVFFKSQLGWTLSYDGGLLYIPSDAKDTYDPTRNAYETVWHSNLHGKSVAFYVQVSRNEKCRTALEYGKERIANHRVRADRRPYSVVNHEAVLIEGSGLIVDGRVDHNVRSIDFVFIGPADKSMVLQIGARFPPGELSRYRSELMKIMDSWTYPPTDPFAGYCPERR
jgi:hypothetical protein